MSRRVDRSVRVRVATLVVDRRRTCLLRPGVGTYQLSAAQPFGLYGYGYDNAVSYGYPGGLNLTTTP